MLPLFDTSVARDAQKNLTRKIKLQLKKKKVSKIKIKY